MFFFKTTLRISSSTMTKGDHNEIKKMEDKDGSLNWVDNLINNNKNDNNIDKIINRSSYNVCSYYHRVLIYLCYNISKTLCILNSTKLQVFCASMLRSWSEWSDNVAVSVILTSADVADDITSDYPLLYNSTTYITNDTWKLIWWCHQLSSTKTKGAISSFTFLKCA